MSGDESQAGMIPRSYSTTENDENSVYSENCDEILTSNNSNSIINECLICLESVNVDNSSEKNKPIQCSICSQIYHHECYKQWIYSLTGNNDSNINNCPHCQTENLTKIRKLNKNSRPMRRTRNQRIRHLQRERLRQKRQRRCLLLFYIAYLVTFAVLIILFS